MFIYNAFIIAYHYDNWFNRFVNNSVKASSQRTGIAARGFVTFIERSGVVFRVATCALTKDYQGDCFRRHSTSQNIECYYRYVGEWEIIKLIPLQPMSSIRMEGQ